MTIDGPRACTAEELPEALAVQNQVLRLDAGHAPSIADDWPQIYNEANLENVRVIKSDGKVVSAFGMNRAEVRLGSTTIQSAAINNVATYEAYRKRGLCGHLLNDAISMLRELGGDICILGTPIPDYYRRFDWEYGGTKVRYVLDRETIKLLPDLGGLTVEKGFDGRWEEIFAIYDSGNIGATLDAESFRIGRERHVLEAYSAVKNGSISAYIITILFQDQKHPVVCEYGGDVDAALALVKHAFREWDEPTMSTSDSDSRFHHPEKETMIEVESPGFPTELSSKLDDLRMLKNTDYFYMINVVNPSQLLRKIGLADATVVENDDVMVTRAGCSETFTRRELVKWIFGPERISDFCSDVLPVELFYWRVDTG